MDHLRTTCPWNQKQTMERLRHLTIEETFELSEAILEGDMESIKKELGDLLLHVVFHALIAAERQSFTITDVIQALCAKLIYRHPHIYDKEQTRDTQEVQQNWEKLKLKEQGNSSVLGGIPNTLPSLIKAMRVQEKASRIGIDWENKEEVWKTIQEAMQAYKTDPGTTHLQKSEDKFGDILFALVRYARLIDVNAESALEKANKKFIRNFQHMEQHVAGQGKHITQLSTEELMSYWEKAEQQTSSE